MKKEYKKYFDKHILTKSILLSGLVTCEEQINKYAYMEKKWKNRYESNDPVYYESYKACRLEWMGMREKRYRLCAEESVSYEPNCATGKRRRI